MLDGPRQKGQAIGKVLTCDQLRQVYLCTSEQHLSIVLDKVNVHVTCAISRAVLAFLRKNSLQGNLTQHLKLHHGVLFYFVARFSHVGAKGGEGQEAAQVLGACSETSDELRGELIEELITVELVSQYFNALLDEATGRPNQLLVMDSCSQDTEKLVPHTLDHRQESLGKNSLTQLLKGADRPRHHGDSF